VLANRLPWPQIEAALAPAFERKNRQGEVVEINGLFGTTLVIAGGGVSAAGRPRLPIRLMASLLYLKHAFNLSDEELVIRWSENVVWQAGKSTTHRSYPATPHRSVASALPLVNPVLKSC
jgi:IS5 family transposase